MISKSVLTIRFGLAKNKQRQAEANMYYPVCTIIDPTPKPTPLHCNTIATSLTSHDFQNDFQSDS